MNWGVVFFVWGDGWFLYFSGGVFLVFLEGGVLCLFFFVWEGGWGGVSRYYPSVKKDQLSHSIRELSVLSAPLGSPIPF